MGDLHRLDLPVTALGLVTSVGRSWRAACAAMAAGVSRPRPVDHFEVLDEDGQVLVPVVGHPVRGFSDGFSMAARWMRLALGAWDDARCSGGLPAEDDPSWRRTALLAVLPHANNPRFQDEEGGGLVALDEAFALPLAASFGLAGSPRHVVALTHAGLAVALARAAEVIGAGTVDRAVIVAADSYLDPLTLRWLAEASRLKGPERATGLAPGEAAAVVVVESPRSVRARKAPVLARVQGVSLGQEAASALGGEPNTGVGLAKALAAVVPALPRPYRGEIYLDLNGETWRAAEWGGAQVRLRGVLDDAVVQLPAACLGDTGAASAAVGLCCAAHRLLRGGPAGPALVVSSSEWGDLGCIVLAGGAA